MKTFTVQQLINKLSEIKNKNLPVYGYVTDKEAEYSYQIVPIVLVDDSISDRVDINLEIDE